MSTYTSPEMRAPKGDHNRRLSLGIDIDDFAKEAGLTREQVHDYEMTPIEHNHDLDVAQKYGIALNRLEDQPPPSQKVRN